jgi:outer membrane lipoprotein-sorting protein
MKFIVTAIMSVMLFGCAAKATTPSVQDQLNDHMKAVEADHTAMAQKNAEQDAAIADINARLDRGFRKGN